MRDNRDGNYLIQILLIVQIHPGTATRPGGQESP